MLIRVWIRTGCATRSCFETFLSALCHEFCHRLDFRKYGFPDSWHTRGFYERASALCTPMRGGRRPSGYSGVAAPGGRWRIDWPRTRAQKRKPRE